MNETKMRLITNHWRRSSLLFLKIQKGALLLSSSAPWLHSRLLGRSGFSRSSQGHRKCTTNSCPPSPSSGINRVSPQCSAGPIDCSNLLMEMGGRRSTYWAIPRCYLDSGRRPLSPPTERRCLHVIIRGDTTRQNTAALAFALPLR